MAPASEIRQAVCIFLTSTGLATILTLAAAAQNPRGSLQGKVQDSGGARVGAAVVKITDAQISIERSAQANSLGEFRIDNLPPGNYHLVVQASGFADASA